MFGHYRRDAPTASRLADAMCIFIIVSLRFEAFLGDIKQAFFQGKKFQRNIYLEQPIGGLRGLIKRAAPHSVGNYIWFLRTIADVLAGLQGDVDTWWLAHVNAGGGTFLQIQTR